MKKLKKLVLLLLDHNIFRRICSFRYSGYLHDIGWFNSFITQSSIGKNNEPIPWVTYPFIDFIQHRLNKQMSIFEFGSGNSTLFYAEKVKSIVATEHDHNWYSNLLKIVPQNVHLMYKNIDVDCNEYCSLIKEFSAQSDIVIVYGRQRVKCIENTIDSVKDSTVIILDDSEREKYKDGIALLENRGYRRIDFWGIAPGIFFNKCTTLFYKNNNVLGI